MQISNEILTDYKQTVFKVLEYSKKYKDDWSEVLKYCSIESPVDFYEYVRKLPFLGDRGGEILSRAIYTLNPNWTYNRDCDDKTLAICNYAESNLIPYRLKVIGEKKTPHHIYPELNLNGNWYVFDATFPERCFFGKKLYSENFVKIFYPT